ncbi:MFS transporter [Hymenobacter bucti]|uniref:MFS transporter n=1 Tax=Hymenobacter bucti TaxID=1844114 RepID=A0ABW4R115_9BACT
MPTTLLPTPAPPGKAEQGATRLVFFVIGLSGAAWAPLVPFAKIRNQLNEGQLGLLLLCLGIGSILAMPVAGALAARYGCRRVILAAMGLVCLALPLLSLAAPLALLAPALFVFGVGLGSVDCVINMQAVLVERASGRTLMSGFHGFFSVGGMVGAGSLSALLSAGVSPVAATGILTVVSAGVLLYAAPHLLAYGSSSTGPAFALPRGVVLFIGLLCFILFLTEGSILDWSAVFLSTERAVKPAWAGLGYTVFSLAMLLGRFTGDVLVRRLGGRVMLSFGGLLAALGLTLTVLVPSWQVGLGGYALVGAGCANMVPVLFSAVGRQQVMPAHLAIPAISTIGYAGILAGPALIGFVAQATNFTTAFLCLAALLVGVAASSRKLAV